jgi:uncharacterized Zn finger protein
MQTRTRRACGVCGGHEFSLDEVLDAGVLGLAECERCGHLWTERPLLAWTERPLLAVPRALAGAETEVAEAA